MSQLLYSLYYPLSMRLRESQSQSMFCRHEESPSLGQNQTLIPQAAIPHPRHHGNTAILATEGIISPNCNTTQCQSEVYYINWRCYLLTLRLCQKNIWTSQIERTDRTSVLWWVSLHRAAIEATDRFKCIHRNYITPQTDRETVLSRYDSCSPTQEIPYKLPIVPNLSYLYPVQSLANLLPKDLSLYYSPNYVYTIQIITSLQVFWKFCLNFPLLLYALHVLPVSHFNLFTVRIMTKSMTGQHSSKWYFKI
jgi:hypothetical protein